jgi:hypothetical protein
MIPIPWCGKGNKLSIQSYVSIISGQSYVIIINGNNETKYLVFDVHSPHVDAISCDKLDCLQIKGKKCTQISG